MFRFSQALNNHFLTRHHMLSFLNTGADVVVYGGGVTSLSIACNLAKRGKTVRVLAETRVGEGSVNFGFATSPIFWEDGTKQHFAKLSLDLYNSLAQKYEFQLHRCGRIYMSNNAESNIRLKRMFSRRCIYGENVDMYDDIDELSSKYPLLNPENVFLALHSSSDLLVNKSALCGTLGIHSIEHGVHISENCRVKEVLVDSSDSVYGVRTDKGIIETECFVDANGINSTSLLSSCKKQFSLAMHPMICQYLVSQKIPSYDYSIPIPIFTHIDEKIFLYSNENFTICGGFEGIDHRPLLQNKDEWSVPHNDWDLFYNPLKLMLNRFDAIKNSLSGSLVCDLECYTPDNNPIIGAVSSYDGYYVACGFNGHELSLAGGVAEAIGDLIFNRTPEVDLSKVEPNRFNDLHYNPRYLLGRAREVAGRIYTDTYEYYQYRTSRNLRMSPIYHNLKNAGAVFGEFMGYERPLWFAQNQKDDDYVYHGPLYPIGRPKWFDLAAQEYEACRERIGLIDLSSYSKFDINGPDCVEFLQKLCSSNVDRPIGTTLYTGMHNDCGGYVTDCTISRLGNEHFFAIAPTVQQTRFRDWLNKWIKKLRCRVHFHDVTGLYTALDIVGPSTRNLMKDLTEQSMTPSSFPNFAMKVLNIGIATGIRVISISHCGELGYVLYIPNEVAVNVYERIVNDGRRFGLQHVGYYALRQLRIEKFYVFWGQDINSLVTPMECGRTFRVDFNKDFFGKDALLNQIEQGFHIRYVQLLVGNHNLNVDSWPQGCELLYRNDKVVGRTTSAAYGFTLGCQICLGYLENRDSIITDEFIKEGKYEIDIAGKRFPVKVNIRSPTLPMISSEHPTHYKPTQQ